MGGSVMRNVPPRCASMWRLVEFASPFAISLHIGAQLVCGPARIGTGCDVVPPLPPLLSIASGIRVRDADIGRSVMYRTTFRCAATRSRPTVLIQDTPPPVIPSPQSMTHVGGEFIIAQPEGADES